MRRLFKKKGRNPFPTDSKNADKKNKGYLRLLKDLEADWPTMYRDESIWNDYQCFSDDLKFMVEQGILFESKSIEEPKGRTISYYKLGIKGFEYLFIRKVNFFMIIIGIFTILSFIISIFSLIIN